MNKLIRLALVALCFGAGALYSMPAVADDVTVSSSEGAITVTVAAGTVEETAAVYLVWDTTDKGETFAAWAHSAKLGDVTSTGGTFPTTGAAHSIPNGAKIRAFVMSGEIIELCESITKAKTVLAAIDTGYRPNATTTSGFDLDVAFANTTYLANGDETIIFGVKETSTAANASSGASAEYVQVNFGAANNNYYQFFTWPHIYQHKSMPTKQTYRVLNDSVATVSSRGVLKLRTGAAPNWTRNESVVTAGTDAWPSHITYNYAEGSTIAVFGEKVGEVHRGGAQSAQVVGHDALRLQGVRVGRGRGELRAGQ